MKIAAAFLILVVLVLIGWWFTKKSPATPPASEQKSVSQPATTQRPTTQPTEQFKSVKAAEIAGAATTFSFSAEVPNGWEAEAVSATQAINFYDPNSSGANNLEKSQIFVRFFSGNSFLTLSTVTIHSREETSINGRPAVRYDIEKKANVAQFSGQPSWRSERHIVTDVRVSDSNPSVFYVIAKRPDLADATYQKFLDSFKVRAEQSSLIEPIDQFLSRITKKPFGILINPATSPVQPERFSGYHTGVDIEYEDKPDDDIPVRAISEGSVLMATNAAGYGGVLVIGHKINGERRLVLYGHLDLKSLPKKGTQVSAGQQIGLLGEGGTSETDGGRKHLHFALLKTNKVDLRGYVATKRELEAWQNPLTIY